MKGLLLFVFATITAASCSKKDLDGMPKSFVGTWVQTQVLVNEHWGGPFYWKNGNQNIQITFTSDGQYFRANKAEGTNNSSGTYKVLSDSTIEVTLLDSAGLPASKQVLIYQFEKGGYVTLGHYVTEGLIKERYRLVK